MKRIEIMPYALIVAETNPLHYGHTYLIQRAKESGYGVVVLMSASFYAAGPARCDGQVYAGE